METKANTIALAVMSPGPCFALNRGVFLVFIENLCKDLV
jgi:hypothetical protein